MLHFHYFFDRSTPVSVHCTTNALNGTIILELCCHVWQLDSKPQHHLRVNNNLVFNVQFFFLVYSLFWLAVTQLDTLFQGHVYPRIGKIVFHLKLTGLLLIPLYWCSSGQLSSLQKDTLFPIFFCFLLFNFFTSLVPYWLVHCFFYVLCFCRLTEESVYLPAVWQSPVLKGKPQAAHCGQARGAPGRVPLCHL